MTTEHTPEPLRIAAGDPTFITVPHVAKPINCGSQALARRIVACVNACAGINTESLTGWALASTKRSWLDQNASLIKQRDALAEALRRWQQHFDQGDLGRHVTNALAFDQTLSDTRAALAKLS